MTHQAYHGTNDKHVEVPTPTSVQATALTLVKRSPRRKAGNNAAACRWKIFSGKISNGRGRRQARAQIMKQRKRKGRKNDPPRTLRALRHFFCFRFLFRLFVFCFSRICSLLYFTCFRFQTSSSMPSSSKSSSSSSGSSSWPPIFILTSAH